MDYNEIVEGIVKKGAFGDVEFVSCSLNENVDVMGVCSVSFVDICVNDGKRYENMSVVIKLQPRNKLDKLDVLQFDDCFKNEVIAFRDLLPLLNVSESKLFPRLIYGHSTEGRDYEKDIIVIENLMKIGFDNPRRQLIMDFEQVSLALNKLGEFHALSHLAKKREKTKFFEYCAKLSKSKFEKNTPDMQLMCETSMKRGIQAILNKGIETELLIQFLDSTKDMKSFVEKIIKPEEPFAVLCHGDFNRFNILYKYNEVSFPTDVRFIDLQNVRYTSPAVDISFMLYMGTTQEQREKHWDEYLSAYWKGFTNVLTEPEFDFHMFREHFSARAVYGYVPCSFYVPAVMDKEPLPPGFLPKLNVEERKEFFSKRGGDEATSRVSDIVEHLLKNNYIRKYLEL